MNEQENIQNEIEIEEESKKKDVGKKVLKVLKFISLTIVKMVFVILTLASLIVAALGAIFSVIQMFNANSDKEKAREIRSKGWLTQKEKDQVESYERSAKYNATTGSLLGLLASGCFFLTKSLHGVLRKYLWPALGGLAICIIVIVLVEPDFYVEARNFVQQEILNNGKSSGTVTNSTSSTSTYSQPQTSTKNSTPKSSQSGTSAKKEPAGLTKIGDLTWSSKAEKWMDWNDAINYCKKLNEGRYSDWRLPTISELKTLIQNCQKTMTGGECGVTNNCLSYSECRNDACGGCDYDSNNLGKYSKLVDSGYFWSSSTTSDSSNFAWGVNFNHGDVSSNRLDDDNYVRCVRGSQNEITAKKESSETTKLGNLLWSSNASDKMKWNSAVKYCKNLNEGGYSNWRLPNIDELRTLIQNCSGTESGGACQASEKSDCLSSECWTSEDCTSCAGDSSKKYSKLGDTDWYWSSSTFSDNTESAFGVNFDNGIVGKQLRKTHYYKVRCVK